MRETKKIVLPDSKIEVELYTYLSQRAYNEMINAFNKERKAKFVQGKGLVNEEEVDISFEAMEKAQEANIKYMIHSVAGETGPVSILYDKILEVSKKDFAFIVSQINELTKEDEDEKKNLNE